MAHILFFFFSSRRRHTRSKRDWSSDVCSSDLRTAGLPQGVVLMDAGYGNDTGLRTDITALGLRYVAGIGPNTSVWPPGEAPMAPQSRTGRGRPQTRLQRGQHQPTSVKTLALSLPREAWQTITW